MRLISRSFAVLAKSCLIVWASPNTLIGLTIGSLGLLTGGRMQRGQGAIEFYGGAVTWLLRRLPVNASAMTLGHTILGQSIEYLDYSRNHEMVHVRQYERWGILFLPAYGLSSLVLRWQGRDAYRDNPFEVQAYNEEPHEH